jgi:hypothetical protein
MEVILPSKTLVTAYKTTWYHNPEDYNQFVSYLYSFFLYESNNEFVVDVVSVGLSIAVS